MQIMNLDRLIIGHALSFAKHVSLDRQPQSSGASRRTRKIISRFTSAGCADTPSHRPGMSPRSSAVARSPKLDISTSFSVF